MVLKSHSSQSGAGGWGLGEQMCNKYKGTVRNAVLCFSPARLSLKCSQGEPGDETDMLLAFHSTFTACINLTR